MILSEKHDKVNSAIDYVWTAIIARIETDARSVPEVDRGAPRHGPTNVRNTQQTYTKEHNDLDHDQSECKFAIINSMLTNPKLMGT